MKAYFSWRKQKLSDQNGVLVGADMTQEWILPWWWKRYTQKNTFPVAFVDFGMSFEMKEWCQKRGELIPLRIWDFAIPREEMQDSLVQKFEEDYGDSFWECRNCWFKKPLACLQSPFRATLWVDLDCEIRCSLAPLFELDGFAIAKDQIAFDTPYPIYNSGVMLFRRDLALMENWAQASVDKNHLFRGDQELLSWILAESQHPVTEIAPVYNWSRSLDDHPDVRIYHLHGPPGKIVIRHQLHGWNASEKG